MSSKFAEMAEKLAESRGLFDLAESAAVRQLVDAGIVKAADDAPADTGSALLPGTRVKQLPADYMAYRGAKGAVKGLTSGLAGAPPPASPLAKGLLESGIDKAKTTLGGPEALPGAARQPTLFNAYNVPATAENVGQGIGYPLGQKVRGGVEAAKGLMRSTPTGAPTAAPVTPAVTPESFHAERAALGRGPTLNSTAVPGLGQDQVQAGFEAAGRAGKQISDVARRAAPKVRDAASAVSDALPGATGAAVGAIQAAGGGFMAGKPLAQPAADIAAGGVKTHPILAAASPAFAGASVLGGKMTPAGTSALAAHPGASSALESATHGARKLFNAAADITSGGLERRMDESGNPTGGASFYEKNVQQPVAKGLWNVGESPSARGSTLSRMVSEAKAEPRPGASMAPDFRAPPLPANWETMGSAPKPFSPGNFKPIPGAK